MQSPTEHFTKYQGDILSARALVVGVPADRSNTPLQHLKVQSLVLFAHAAMEEYLERLGWAAAVEARKLFKEQNVISFPLVSLIASKIMGDIPERAKRKLSQDLVTNLAVFSEQAVSQYYKALDDNNGVVEQDQKTILLPIGIDPETFDIVLMNNLNAFGERRGSIAHKFSAIRNELTLGDALQKIEMISEGLQKIDEAVCANLARHMG